jgi:hypothetical protein
MQGDLRSEFRRGQETRAELSVDFCVERVTR